MRYILILFIMLSSLVKAEYEIQRTKLLSIAVKDGLTKKEFLREINNENYFGLKKNIVNEVVDTCQSVETSIVEIIKLFDKNNYQEISEVINKTDKNKIIILGTELSCACTKNLANDYLSIALKNYKKNKTEFYYVDAYDHDEFQIKYRVDFLPAILVLDKDNKVLKKYEYEHDLSKIKL